MALKSTIYKAEMSIADIDHAHYENHDLTIARHPSETELRMMVRVLAFAINAHQVQSLCGGDGAIGFGAGLSSAEEPDLWVKDFQGLIKLWVDVGQPEEKPIARACQRAELVQIYCFSQAADPWWKRIEPKLNRSSRLQVFRIAPEGAEALSHMAQRQMHLQATIQDAAISLSSDKDHLTIPIERLR